MDSEINKLPEFSRIHCMDVEKLPDRCLVAEIDNINVCLFL